MAVIVGINAKAYYKPLLNPADGTPWNVPTPSNPFPSTDLPVDAANSHEPMALLTNIRNLNLNLEKSTADITTRGGNGWRQKVGVLKDGTVTFQMVWDSSDVGFSNVQYAFFNDTHINLAILDADAEDTTTGFRIQGLYAPFSVTNFSRNEDLEEALLAEVSVSIARGSGCRFRLTMRWKPAAARRSRKSTSAATEPSGTGSASCRWRAGTACRTGSPRS